MPYATLQDLATRFGQEELTQLTDRTGIDAIDANVVTAKLADADARIESYLAQRYALPVTPVPQLLRGLACDIARFLLAGDAASEAVRTAHEDALDVLRELSSGKAALPGAAPALPGATPAVGGGGRAQFVSAARRLDATSIGEFFG